MKENKTENNTMPKDVQIRCPVTTAILAVGTTAGIIANYPQIKKGSKAIVDDILRRKKG